MIPPPPTSTLFPYTTLFRSFQSRATAGRRGQGPRGYRPVAGDHHGTASSCGDRKDRKSTRLNSSHVRISYAVFCLKKKTIFSTQTSIGLLCYLSTFMVDSKP